MYTRRGVAVAAVAAVAALVACHDSSGPTAGLSLARMAGTWDLSEYALLLESDTTVQFDLKAAAALSVTLTMATSGAATVAVTAEGQGPETIAVTITLQGDTLTLSATGNSFAYRVALAGSRMSWLALYTDEFADLDGDGFLDETRERLTWLRR